MSKDSEYDWLGAFIWIDGVTVFSDYCHDISTLYIGTGDTPFTYGHDEGSCFYPVQVVFERTYTHLKYKSGIEFDIPYMQPKGECLPLDVGYMECIIMNAHLFPILVNVRWCENGVFYQTNYIAFESLMVGIT